MGNSPSSADSSSSQQQQEHKKQSFPGSALLDSAGFLCGNADDATDDSTTQEEPSMASSLLAKADAMCISSPKQAPPVEEEPIMNPTSALFARALVSEVTDNPRTMTPAAMAEREKRLLKAQEAARKPGAKPVGTMGQPNVLGSLANASHKEEDAHKNRAPAASVVPPNSLLENRAQQTNSIPPRKESAGKHSVTIGLSLSRRHSTLGHADTVTRQTAFDFNELQDREYKYVSSTDSSGWLAGGGERGGNAPMAADEVNTGVTSMLTPQGHHKVAAPDTVHIPIIRIDAESPAAINMIVAALARGEVFIPHMTVLPEALSVNGISPPDLVVRFGCERNDDSPPDEWPNWCLEFMHNQLYEYFGPMGAQWSPRPFQITLASKVRWKTVKHMNRYFAHAERVIDAWREQGPQYLDPQLSYIEGGATPEEVARPHGIYLLRNGVPTNYFAPNFDPPYTTKMTRSLLLNVLSKSWDKKRREWTSEPVPRLVTPAILMATMCGCTDPGQGGFMANEVTNATTTTTTTNATNTATTASTTPSVEPPAEPKSTAVEQAISSESEEEEEEELQIESSVSDLNIQSSVSGTSTKMSSVLLTPYNPEDAAALGTKLDAVALETLKDEDDEEGEAKEPEPVISPPTSMKDEDDLDWDNVDFRASRGVRGRYGSSPTPERGPFRGRNPPPPSEFNESTATLPHMNINPERRAERELRRGKLEPEGAIDDDENVTPKSTSSSGKKKRKNKNKIKEAYEKERARQIAMIALAQEETSKMQLQITSSPKKKELALSNGNSPRYSMQNTTSKPQKPIPDMQRNDSGSVSLDYSMDSSLLGDSSTLAGQHFAGDGSVSTVGRKSKWSAAEDDSVQDSEVSAAVVPSDEELFAVGWAKALDPKTGSYYYFTLDRSKIVWDNPLDDVLTEASSSIPSHQTALMP